MAIQGKLVPQNPDDEPASVLLERIREEKQRLIKEGKIKKDKTDSIIFKGEDNCHYEKTGSEVKNITDEIDFDLPEGWEWVRIKNFCLVIFSGKSPKYSKNETSHKVIGQQANQWSGVNMQYVKYCTNDFVREMPESYYLQNGDVLLNTLGNGTLGRSGIFYNNSSNERVLTDGHLFVFRTQNKVLSKYLLLFLRTKYDEIVKSANGTTNQTFLSLGKTSQWLIPVPPENEIIKIISELDKYEPLLIEYDIFESHKAKLDGEIYDKLKKSILQYAIQGKLVPQDSNDEPAAVLLERIRAEKKAQLGKKYVECYIFKGDDNRYYEKNGAETQDITDEIPFDIPDSWNWCRLKEIIDFSKSITVSSNEIDDESWILDLEDIEKDSGRLLTKKRMSSIKSKSDKHKFFAGNVLYSKLRPYLNKVIVADESGYCTTEILAFDFGKHIINYYAKIYLMSPYFVDYAMAGSYGVKMPRIGSEHGNAALFPLPPLQEQHRIVEKINLIFSKLKDED